MATDTMPASRETRVPQITRDSTSRPTLSVPSTWARPGRASALSRSCLRGSYGASTEAPNAMTSAASSTAAPNGASRARAARRSARQRPSADPDARVEPAIEQVDDQVAGDEAERDQQDHALHQRIIA